jgi:hypothetical protein
VVFESHRDSSLVLTYSVVAVARSDVAATRSA